MRAFKAQLSEDEQGEPSLIAKLDELQTFVSQKKNKVRISKAINRFCQRIKAIAIGDRNGKTFLKLWKIES